MKNAERKPLDLAASFKTRAFRVGGYSVAAVVIVLAIAIVVNLLASAIPTRYTQFDTTSNQLFTISDQTKKILDGLDDQVTIYWIVRSGEEDETLGTLLDRYAGLSSQVKVVKRDPDVYPAFVQQYVTGTVTDNSLVVESGQRTRYVDYYDIYEYDYSSYYYTGSYSASFAGESAVTSAIDYVVSESIPKVYALTGHGETELPATFSSAVEKENIEVGSLSLLTEDAVPEDADAILICAPQRDISEEEKELLLAYLQGGGSMLLVTSPLQDETLTNLEEVMVYYGVTAQEGIVAEGSQNNYYGRGGPLYLLPSLSSHAITAPLNENGYYVLLPIAQGLTVSGDLRDSLSVTQLLTTSSSAFSKVAGYGMTTYEKEDGDIDGPFALAVAVTETLEDDAQTHIVWVSSAALVDEDCSAYVSGGNLDVFLNALSWMCEQEESSLSIHSKSLSYEYLTMSGATASYLTVLMVGIIPIVYLGVGIYIWIRRKRR